MLAAVYDSARNIRTRNVTVPDPGPGQVRIDVAYTGICGTDLHIFHGHMDSRVQAPTVIGHEMSGTIAALGPGVTGWALGDPVTVMPLRWCGTCPACLAGHSHICQHLEFIGIDAAGSMQNSWIVPAELLVALPVSLDLASAALVEPVAVAVHDVRRAELGRHDTAVVIGGGPVGLLIAQVATLAGADVLIFEVNAYRRRLAAELGLRAADPMAVSPVDTVNSWTKGAGATAAFEVSGAAAGVDTAVAVLGVRGRLVQVAIHPDPRPVDLHRFFWRELQLLGARLYNGSDFVRAVELVADSKIRVRPLISATVPLAEAHKAFDALEAGRTMKILVDCRTQVAP
ncbi:zinc-dependent alcohol dehydrogenase [Pseudarthrobacter oxydans]|uniref:zinc-dependent alcohol dehydrogenase n=1 Tax=Pseudarthrobacter oxydans TaxID=1671 RepID=UPI003821A48A